MAEYIEREAAVNLILETPFTMSMCLSEQECHGMNSAKQIIARLIEDTIPAADVRENVIRTQADRIRGMSNEELAKKLAWRAECPDKAHQDKCNEDCFGCWLDWLKSPVEVEDGDPD